MTTITATELRSQLGPILKRASAGESFRVTYRSGNTVTIAGDKPTNGKRAVEPGSPEAMQRFLKNVAKHRRSIKKSVFDPNKSIKELYHEMLDNDPKYKPPYHR